jgi:hypothetical protein
LLHSVAASTVAGVTAHEDFLLAGGSGDWRGRRNSCGPGPGRGCSGAGRRRVRPPAARSRPGAIEIDERLQRGGEEVPQRRTQPQDMAAAFPDQALVGACDQLDCFGFLGVTGQGPVMGPVDADDLCQQVRVAGIFPDRLALVDVNSGPRT